MGYYVDVFIRNVRIPFEKKEEALSAINALHTDANLIENANGGMAIDVDNKPVRETKWYAWVGNPPEGGFSALEEAVAAWRYSPAGSEGDVVFEYFTGQKWGDDRIFYNTIAPYVCDGGEIEVRGEDGARWKYHFENGKVRKEELEVLGEN